MRFIEPPSVTRSGEFVVRDSPADEEDAARDGPGVAHGVAHELGEDDLDVVEQGLWQVLGSQLAPDVPARGADGGRLVTDPQDVRCHVGLRSRVWGVHRASPFVLASVPAVVSTRVYRRLPMLRQGGHTPRPVPPNVRSDHASWSRRP